ncbi:hypothetical protein [Salinibacter ruber]|jgi:hypothetical protein|uniref:Uncharacterized protein n=1 Tax=Salinibacter ruber TaxID=146919 RepID=A0A9X2TEZ4_9BACT|nr:hypothetical protein [Salinibacter ruber]MCS3659936.1 hypothetical protein [Salinibacter ruber]MCS3709977.1 hypothetical protein [Salinibacter ruber]MCS4170197.1 hypothetical protein [Salinibacter ruber]
MNSEPKNAKDLTPEEALSLEEGDALLHNETVVFVEKVEEGFGLLDEGEVMVWAAAEDGEGRGISIKETEI